MKHATPALNEKIRRRKVYLMTEKWIACPVCDAKYAGYNSVAEHLWMMHMPQEERRCYCGIWLQLNVGNTLQDFIGRLAEHLYTVKEGREQDLKEHILLGVIRQ